MLTVLGRTRRTCDGVNRRELLQVGGAGLLGMSLQKLAWAEAIQKPRAARAKSVLFVFLYGGAEPARDVRHEAGGAPQGCTMLVKSSIRRFVSQDRLLANAICATVLAALFVIPGQSGRGEEKPTARQAEKPKHQPEDHQKPHSRITVSRETTRLIQPLDDNGYVDYLAALNQRSGQGVTPENNAGVLLIRAIGLPDLKSAERARFFELLKVEPLPEAAEYLTAFDDFIKRKLGRPPTKEQEAEFDDAMKRPWSGGGFPLVAEWLRSNEKLLDLVVEGTRRPKCYLPLVAPAHAVLIGIPLPAVQASRTAARGLAIRGMTRIKEGRIGEAEQDLLACHRLGRHLGSTPFLIGALVGITIDNIAFQGDAQLLEYGNLSAKGALAYQQELRKLRPMPVIADEIDGSERFTFLDAVSIMMRRRSAIPDVVEFSDVANTLQVSKHIERLLKLPVVDCDQVLRFGNEQFDKAVAAARKPTFRDRKTAFEVLEREQSDGLSKLSDPVKVAFSGESMGRIVGRLFAKLLMPALSAPCIAEDRVRTHDGLVQLGCALSAYRADRATYPESLGDLTPKYIAQVPTDLFTDESLRYKRQGAGFLLYSVGENGADDGGLTFESQPPRDDIVLRVTHERAKEQ